MEFLDDSDSLKIDRSKLRVVRCSEKGGKAMKKAKKNVGIKIGMIAGSIGVLLILVYAAIAMYYNSHYFPGTKINDYACSNKTATSVERMLAKELKSYAIAVQKVDGSIDMLYGSTFDLHMELEVSPKELMERQNGWTWIAAIFGDNEVSVNTKIVYDTEKLKTAVNALNCMNPSKVVEPVDAYIEYAAGEYKIVPAKDGNQVSFDLMYQAVCQAIESQSESLNLVEAGVYAKAAIQADDSALVKEQERLNSYCGFTITVPFGDKEEIIDSALIYSIMEDGEPSLDQLEDYVIDKFAVTYNTYGSGQPRTFKTALGGVEEIYGGDYGWWLDWWTTASDIYDAILEGKDAVVEPTWHQTADVFGRTDWGNTYIELDITTQHMWVFVDGKKVFEAPVTTGNVSKEFDTPTGTQRVMYKTTKAKLTGEGYSEVVDYFIVFTTNTGFHDAKWQAEDKFGTDYYLKNGSHGCVRMKLADAKKLYELVEVGMPVFIYKS